LSSSAYIPYTALGLGIKCVNKFVHTSFEDHVRWHRDIYYHIRLIYINGLLLPLGLLSLLFRRRRGSSLVSFVDGSSKVGHDVYGEEAKKTDRGLERVK